VQAARPETERLAHALRGTGCAVLLFNGRGVVIDRLCHEAAAPAMLLVATRKGINVAERCVGTSAPAIALADGLPYLVGRDAHFFANVRPFFCVAAPIDSPAGVRLGALDITAYDSVPSFDVYSLVVDAAAAIENSLFRPAHDAVVVHFHPRAEFLGSPLEGLLQVSSEGRITGANRVASRLLCQPRSALLGRAFSELFDRRLQSLFNRPGRHQADVVEMLTPSGLQVMARFEGETLARRCAFAARSECAGRRLDEHARSGAPGHRTQPGGQRRQCVGHGAPAGHQSQHHLPATQRPGLTHCAGRRSGHAKLAGCGDFKRIDWPRWGGRFSGCCSVTC
jgi:transcriptional regulator of acetoin/glycerol metabolism